MIRRLSLTNWRSYEQLDIELEVGTTFILAPNGVGKSSLVMAMAWGVYGDDSGINSRECIRGDATESTVGVELDLPSGKRLTVRRTIRLKGKGRFSAELDGQPLTEAALRELYETEFSVSPAVAARLALMGGRGDSAMPSSLDLEDHLYRAFGVDNLVVNAQTAREAAKKAAKARQATRSSHGERLAGREAAEAELTAARGDAADARQAVDVAKAALKACDGELAIARRFVEYASEVERREGKLREVLDLVRTSVDRAADQALDASRAKQAILERLSELEAETEQAAEAERSFQVARASAEQALEMLDAPSATCPTCLRPIADHELEHAAAEQEARRDTAERELTTLSASLREMREKLASVRELGRQLEALAPPPPPAELHAPSQLDELEANHAQLLERLEVSNQRLGEAEGRVARLQAALDDDDRAAQENETLVRAFRDEALAEAAAVAIEAARDRAIEMLIEPIAHEVRSRWKRLFHDDGLVLKPDGSMARVIGSRELSWSSLSGGEQAWARIVAHLLIVGSSTTLPFVWFDEPLEHLDPRLRATAAATLARASQHQAPGQLIVTTYEDALAEQLAAGSDAAHLVRVRPSAELIGTDRD